MRSLPPAHREAPSVDTIQVARIASHVDGLLGPGDRAVVWVQGCALRCAGCVVPESHDRAVGVPWTVEALAEWLTVAARDGVTFSGGEPFLQARGLAALCDRLRAARPELSLMSYSGYRLDVLRSRGTEAQRALLERLDLLVDGPFVRRQAGSYLWRGSANQRIWALTDRHRTELTQWPDVGAGVELELGENGELAWHGVPPEGFLDALHAAYAEQGFAIERVVSHAATAGG
jgi:anaerobic ribonucleoside-triphosphate reductase activating protein